MAFKWYLNQQTCTIIFCLLFVYFSVFVEIINWSVQGTDTYMYWRLWKVYAAFRDYCCTVVLISP